MKGPLIRRESEMSQGDSCRRDALKRGRIREDEVTVDGATSRSVKAFQFGDIGNA